jgi:hypothetical protein
MSNFPQKPLFAGSEAEQKYFECFPEGEDVSYEWAVSSCSFA